MRFTFNRLSVLFVLAPAIAWWSPTVVLSQEGVADSVVVADALVGIGGPEDDRLRVRQLLGNEPDSGYLIRSTSTLTRRITRARSADAGWSVVLPTSRLIWNSDIPHSWNDGSMWAGRGLSVQVMAGVSAATGPIFMTFAPQITYVSNQEFAPVMSADTNRSPFSPPWRVGGHSADLPTRFGERSFTQFDLGQSIVGIDAGGVEFGFTTEDQWWGPGIRNSVILSNNAPGVPRVFVRTAEPVRVIFGDVSAQYMSGVLTESLYFDHLPRNDLRSLTGLAVTVAPIWVQDMTVGVARTVVAALAGSGDVPSQTFNPFLWGGSKRSEQVLSLFGRWIFPRDGLELYGEAAGFTTPASIDEVVDRPRQTLGYTVGLQWVRPFSGDSGNALRVQTEATSLERRNPDSPGETADFAYTSEQVVQGYTQRGQLLGAAIGPGASSQWLAVDYLGERSSIGFNLSRVRWDNDAFYTQPSGWSFRAHDVSVVAGIRGRYIRGRAEISAELSGERRMNYLFQYTATRQGESSVDINNLTAVVGVSVVPRR